ncbi:MAG: hypothetical protein Roseis2KO_55890 [Roseivirga sp.]
MNVKLRKRHRYMWFVIGIGLPLLCLEAIEGIQIRPTADIPRISCPADITDCGITERHEISDHAIDMNLASRNGISIIDINYSQPLVSAFTIAYLSNSEQISENSKLIGSLDKMGEYSFELDTEDLDGMTHVIIYDKLKANTLYVQPLNALKQ